MPAECFVIPVYMYILQGEKRAHFIKKKKKIELIILGLNYLKVLFNDK